MIFGHRLRALAIQGSNMRIIISASIALAATMIATAAGATPVTSETVMRQEAREPGRISFDARFSQTSDTMRRAAAPASEFTPPPGSANDDERRLQFGDVGFLSIFSSLPIFESGMFASLRRESDLANPFGARIEEEPTQTPAPAALFLMLTAAPIGALIARRKRKTA